MKRRKASPEFQLRLSELYENDYNKLVSKIAYRVGTRSNAEDVVQEAFCRALKYADTYDETRPLPEWFGTILNNASRDFKKQEVFEGMQVEEEEITLSLEDEKVRDENIEEVLRQIDSKKEPDRTILKGFYLYGHTSGEIAQYVPRTKKEVANTCHYFKRRLRRLSDEESGR